MSRPTRPKDSKGKYEHDHQTSPIERPSDKERVVLEYSWVIVSEVPLDEESGDDPAEKDAGLALVIRDKARILNELGHVNLGDVQPANLWNELRK
jgi:hypothetical protein